MYSVEQNVRAFIQQYGESHVGFFTITFLRCVTTWQQAQARFHSFSRRVLKEIFVHYHLLITTKEDIRAGFNFSFYEALYRDSRKPVNQRMPLKLRRFLSRGLTSNQALKALWKRIRESARAYGVGRCETIPIKKTGAAVARYLTSYITESLVNRKAEHNGTRFVRYSRSFRRPVKAGFSWAGEKGWVWRSKVCQWAVRRGCYSLKDLHRQFGRSWCHRYREQIRATSLRYYPTGKHAMMDGRGWFPPDAREVRIVSSCS